MAKRLETLEPPAAVAYTQGRLVGLERRPEEPLVIQSYADGLRGVRLSGGKTRYGQWPFEPRLIKEEKVESSGAGKPDPSQLPPCFPGAIDQESVEVAWQTSPEEDQPIAGYELEVRLVDALLGSQTWRSFHKGSFGTKIVGCSRAITAVRARVRAYRSGGARGAPQVGPWSNTSPAMRLHPFEAATKVEIAEIPGAWAAVDVAGFEELDERKVGPEELVLRKQALLAAMHEHRMVIKLAFRYYALAGISQPGDDPDVLSMVGFSNLCGACKLFEQEHDHNTDRRRPVLLSDVDRIFIRSVAESRGSALLAVVEASGVKVDGWKKIKAKFQMAMKVEKAKKVNKVGMVQANFVGALIRVAGMCYSEHPSGDLAAKFSALCKNQISHHVLRDLRLLDDNISELMRSRIMGGALELHGEALQQIFAHFSGVDATDKKAKLAAGMMNVMECHELCESLGLYAIGENEFTIKEMLVCFVKVNLDDELFYQEEEGNNASELVFDEFEEWLARCFSESVWEFLMESGALQQATSLLDHDGDGDLDDDDVDEFFDEWDTNQSGSVTIGELSSALGKRLSKGNSEAVATRMMAIADTNADGEISREELRAAVRKIASGEGEEMAALCFERAFEVWLRKTFLPAAKKAIATKRPSSKK